MAKYLFKMFLPEALEVCLKGLLKSGTIRGQQAVVRFNGSSKPIELKRLPTKDLVTSKGNVHCARWRISP